MSEQEAFIAAILDNPEDDTPRLVYADWLDEHGQGHRAELIRLQCAEASLPAGDPRRADLKSRIDDLFWPNGPVDPWAPTLAAQLREMGFSLGGYHFDLHVTFRRGLVEEVSVYDGERGARKFLERASAVFAAEPVLELAFCPATPYGMQYSFTPDLEYADAAPLGLETLQQVLLHPHVRRLRQLDLCGNALTDDAVPLLTAAPLDSLRALLLGSRTFHGSSDGSGPDCHNHFSEAGRTALREKFATAVSF